MRGLRAALSELFLAAIEAGEVLNWAGGKVHEAIDKAISQLKADAIGIELMATASQIALEEAMTAGEPAKTLDELRAQPLLNLRGLDQHDMVQANPKNVQKLLLVASFSKFGRQRIDDPSNIVWISRVKHRIITNYYNQTDPDDPLKRRRREVISEKDFVTQREDALKVLKMFGVLK